MTDDVHADGRAALMKVRMFGTRDEAVSRIVEAAETLEGAGLSDSQTGLISILVALDSDAQDGVLRIWRETDSVADAIAFARQQFVSQAHFERALQKALKDTDLNHFRSDAFLTPQEVAALRHLLVMHLAPMWAEAAWELMEAVE